MAQIGCQTQQVHALLQSDLGLVLSGQTDDQLAIAHGPHHQCFDFAQTIEAVKYRFAFFDVERANFSRGRFFCIWGDDQFDLVGGDQIGGDLLDRAVAPLAGFELRRAVSQIRRDITSHHFKAGTSLIERRIGFVHITGHDQIGTDQHLDLRTVDNRARLDLIRPLIGDGNAQLTRNLLYATLDADFFPARILLPIDFEDQCVHADPRNTSYAPAETKPGCAMSLRIKKSSSASIAPVWLYTSTKAGNTAPV